MLGTGQKVYTSSKKHCKTNFFCHLPPLFFISHPLTGGEGGSSPQWKIPLILFFLFLKPCLSNSVTVQFIIIQCQEQHGRYSQCCANDDTVLQYSREVTHTFGCDIFMETIITKIGLHNIQRKNSKPRDQPRKFQDIFKTRKTIVSVIF